MKKNTLAVFDPDEEYVTKLMSYMNDCRSVPLEIQGFTDKELLKDYIRGNDIDILLIPEDDLDDDIEACETGEMMVLSENDGARDGKGHKSICKYQSSENIMREVMCYYAEQPMLETGLISSVSTEMIVVYSPIRRSFRTSFAFALGEVLAEKEKVLYMNLEEYSGFNQLLQNNFMSDLSDLLFYIDQKKRNFPCKLASMVEKAGLLDYVPPVISPLDILSVSRETWVILFNELCGCDYSKIVVDLSDSISGFLDILQAARTIYMPVREDTVSKAKIEQYEAMLRIMELGEILEKTREISIPFMNELNGNLYSLSDSPMGDFVRAL
ncbi:MAG: hypothetical protein K5668_07815 [Lachnospiraceae bacterium]|nr:hypothetical protein [Lachnospiraceae bacterium]